LLQEALRGGELTFALAYADICLRNLDGWNHTKEEAARWYVAGADAGDGDAASYLQSLSPSLLEQRSPQTRVFELTKIWSDRELVRDANTGFELYTSGDFKNAAKPLKRASLEYHPLAQQFYADICLRKLDEKPHSLKEAAMWYLLSAKGGDPQSYSYLVSIVPNIFESANPNSQMEAIVRKWVYNRTISKLKPVKPGDINNFLVFTYERGINKTTAQKLPYFFDKFVNALLFSVGSDPQVIFEDEVAPILEDTLFPQDMVVDQTSCALEFERTEGRHFVKHSVSCFTYGPVYYSYFTSLDSIQNGTIPRPDKAPNLSAVYKYILSSLNEATMGMNATQFSVLSHLEYPWLLAGVKFWKIKHPFQKLALTRTNEMDIVRSLTHMEEAIPEDDLNELRLIVEGEGIWPNDKEHEVSKEYNDNVRRFFASPPSVDCPLVRQMQIHFFQSLKSQTLNCQDKNALEVLQTPLFMFHCEYLVLNNIASNSACSKAISEGQRYFFHLLRLTINYDPAFNGNSKKGKNIAKIIRKLQNRGFEIVPFNSE
jgi:hypothetical protein